jgi:predicted metal-dependent hydrolase
VVWLVLLEARVMSVEVLEDIRRELRELRLLYKELVEKLIPVEKPSPKEKKAIEEKDEWQTKRN